MDEDNDDFRMTEKEWLDCSNPARMLSFIEPLTTARKLRLFACACARNSIHLLSGELQNVAATCLDAGEGFADGVMSADAMQAASTKLREMPGDFQMAAAAVWSALTVPSPDGWENMAVVASHASLFAAAATDRTTGVESIVNSHLLRDIIGPLPFHAVGVDSAWRTQRVISIARAIYAGRTFELMTDLADALAEAGCCESMILNHCRNSGPHVRGCWVVDVTLGNS